MTAPKLTLKQEAFCRAYIENGGNASEAYRSAYNAGKTKPEAIHANASKLLKNTKVALRIEALQRKHAERHDITVDDLVNELEEARTLAKEVGQPGAAVSATMGKAKLLGHIVEKSEVTGKNGKPIETETVHKLDAASLKKLNDLVG